MDCRHLDDVYELFLLGLLKPKGATEVKEHIERGCPYCVAHLREAALSIYFILSGSKGSKPPKQLKSEILRGLRRT